MQNYYLFLFLALIAEVLGTVSGFGSSILFVPIAAAFFDFKSVLGITAVFHVFSNLSKAALFRKGINKKIIIKLGIPAIIFVLIGAWCTTYIPVTKLEVFMNIVLFGMALFLLFNFNNPLKASNRNLYLGGSISGFSAGIFGTGGAIRGITLAAFNLPKDIFVATSAIIDLGVDSSRAIVYVSNGYFSKRYLILLPFLIIISIAGSYFGKLILNRIPEKTFKYLVLGAIMSITLFQIVNLFLKKN